MAWHGIHELFGTILNALLWILNNFVKHVYSFEALPTIILNMWGKASLKNSTNLTEELYVRSANLVQNTHVSRTHLTNFIYMRFIHFKFSSTVISQSLAEISQWSTRGLWLRKHELIYTQPKWQSVSYFEHLWSCRLFLWELDWY